MDAVILVGQILFGTVFLLAGFDHLTKTSQVVSYAGTRNIRYARTIVVSSGIIMIIATILIILGAWADIAGLLLAVFLVPAAFTMHNYWTHADPQVRAVEQIQFAKNMSLAGASLLIFGFMATFGDELAFTLTPPLTHILA
ncbi:DoxX family membrane protein [Rhodococcus sp. NPDC059968]|uniref:DoxX family membrane protein n=1 Tax=Rhodococcus sp. NPDC059968 TaxID=3347017 RepID=UPI0036702CA5